MDDPTIPRTQDRAGRTTLEALIAGSPDGLDAGRVLRWAEQLAIQIDLRHEQGVPCGAVSSAAITIDGSGAAHLSSAEASAPRATRGLDERDLLLGTGLCPGAAGRAESRDREIRALAAVVREALGGAPCSAGEVLPGVSVHVNLALFSALAPGGDRPASARALVEMLCGGPVPAPPPDAASRRTAPIPAAAAAALGAVALGFLLLRAIDPGGARGPRAADAPHGAEDLLAIDRDLRSAAADRARARWEAVAAGEPSPLFDRLRPEAEEIKAAARGAAALHEQAGAGAARDAGDAAASGFASLLDRHHEAKRAAVAASASWRQALAAQPSQWVDDADVAYQCDEAMAGAEAASAASAEGRFEEARHGWEVAATGLREAHALHAEELTRRAALAADRTPRHGEIEVNTLSQTLVYLGPGRFDMGSPPSEPFRGPAEPRHSVELTRAFWMGRVEVTRGSFATFVEATGHVSDAEKQGWSHGLDAAGRWRRLEGLSWRDPGFHQSDSHPVVCVSHDDAEAFCRWLSEREERIYRLPTEAEWEYAHRAGTDGAFSWGNDAFSSAARANAADASWTSRVPDSVGFPWQDGYVFTSPVATFAANAWGLFDMDGNVREWCLDVYGPYDTGEAVDPLRPAGAGNRAPRVLRGGCFASPPAGCRAAQRDASKGSESFVTVGFRVVMDDSTH